MMKPTGKRVWLLVLCLAITCAIAAASLFQDVAPGGAGDVKNILPEKARAALRNDWLRWRLDNIIPMVMRREGIDMWLVVNREYNEDPVYMSMMPEPTMSARRTSILIFHDRGAQAGVERLTGSYYGTGGLVQGHLDRQEKGPVREPGRVHQEPQPAENRDRCLRALLLRRWADRGSQG